MGICHNEQDISLPSKWFFSSVAQGVYYNVVLKNLKIEFSVQVKNKPCVVYTVMRLIPWKQSHGSETVHIQNVQRHNVQRQNIQRNKVPASKHPKYKTSTASKRPSPKTSQVQNVQASKRPKPQNVPNTKCPKPQNVPNAQEYEIKLCMLSSFYFLLLFSVNRLPLFAELYTGTLSRNILYFCF
jgi:hypothetical protein